MGKNQKSNVKDQMSKLRCSSFILLTFAFCPLTFDLLLLYVAFLLQILGQQNGSLCRAHLGVMADEKVFDSVV